MPRCRVSRMQPPLSAAFHYTIDADLFRAELDILRCHDTAEAHTSRCTASMHTFDNSKMPALATYEAYFIRQFLKCRRHAAEVPATHNKMTTNESSRNDMPQGLLAPCAHIRGDYRHRIYRRPFHEARCHFTMTRKPHDEFKMPAAFYATTGTSSISAERHSPARPYAGNAHGFIPHTPSC